MASVSGQVAGIDAVTTAKSTLQSSLDKASAGGVTSTVNLDANGKAFVNNTGDIIDVAKNTFNAQSMANNAQSLLNLQKSLGINLNGFDTSTTDAQANFLSSYKSYLLGAQNSGGKASTIFSGITGGGSLFG